MRRAIPAILALALLTPCAAAAQHAGLLLGTASDSTIWIAVRGDTLAVRRGPGLIVPRRDGFWQLRWIGVSCPTRAIALPPGAGPAGAVGLTAAPMGRPAPRPALESPTPCHPEHRAEGDETVSDSATLSFVGSDHAVLEYHYKNEGASVATRLHGNASVVLSLDDLGRAGIAFAEFGRDPAAPLDFAMQDRLFTACEDSAAALGEPVLGTTRVLGLRRAQGHWAYDARVYSDCSMCDNEVSACPIREWPPRELVGFDSLTVPWPRIVERLSDAVDAFTSPRGDVVVARDSAALHVFRAQNGALTARVGVVPLSSADIVMTEWALGTSVARWDRILAPALGPVR